MLHHESALVIKLNFLSLRHNVVSYSRVSLNFDVDQELDADHFDRLSLLPPVAKV